MEFLKVILPLFISLSLYSDVVVIQTIDGEYVEVEKNEIFRAANKDLITSKSRFECKPEVMALDALDSNLLFVKRKPFSKIKIESIFKFKLKSNCEEVRDLLNKSKCGLTGSCDLLFCASQDHVYSTGPAMLQQIISTLEDGFEVSIVETFGSIDKCKEFAI
jgi:hypothetical protein